GSDEHDSAGPTGRRVNLAGGGSGGKRTTGHGRSAIHDARVSVCGNGSAAGGERERSGVSKRKTELLADSPSTGNGADCLGERGADRVLRVYRRIDTGGGGVVVPGRDLGDG